VKSCVGFVYASSSEGQAGAVVTCMHAGLIPIISYECGVDISNGAGIVFDHSSIETVKQSVQRIAGLPARELQHMARANWDYARAHYTREQYAKAYREIAIKLLHLS
jgi:glycosyltransferase involved in cell wall biosynthesis